MCLYGLDIIMPLMSRELLRLPQLCSHYYRMLTFIAEIYPNKMCELPPQLMKVRRDGIQMRVRRN